MLLTLPGSLPNGLPSPHPPPLTNRLNSQSLNVQGEALRDILKDWLLVMCVWNILFKWETAELDYL